MIEKNVLLFVHIPTHFKEMIRVARLIKLSGNYKPYIFFDANYENCIHDQALCIKENIDYLCYFSSHSSEKKTNFWLKNIKRSLHLMIKILKKISILLLPFIIILNILSLFLVKIFFSKKLGSKKLSSLLIQYYKILWNNAPVLPFPISRSAYNYFYTIPQLLNDKKIQLIVFPEHNLFYFTQLIVYLGKQSNIPSIIVPFTIANTMEWAEAFYKDRSRSLSLFYNKIIGYAFPHWIHNYKNKKLLLPIELVLLHEMLGITPKYPWLLNSGNIDFIALESKAMKEYYIKAGIDSKYLKETGALYNDELYFKLQNANYYREKLYQHLNLPLNKPMIVCALPPDQCLGREELIEFSNYKEIIIFIIEQLSSYTNQYNIVINLHPRINPKNVEFISQYPIKIFTGDIAEVIPLSNIFIAVCSATIRMAISCGIPVLNYDLYHYNYDDYVNLNGVITIANQKQFLMVLENLCSNKEFYNQIKNAQVIQSKQWGQLDGTSGKKLLNEINQFFI